MANDKILTVRMAQSLYDRLTELTDEIFTTPSERVRYLIIRDVEAYEAVTKPITPPRDKET